jgi:hypothetical protein
MSLLTMHAAAPLLQGPHGRATQCKPMRNQKIVLLKEKSKRKEKNKVKWKE